MDTRALRNPYGDYDGSPQCTQALFDNHGKVRARVWSGWGYSCVCGPGPLSFNESSFFFLFFPCYVSRSHQSSPSGSVGRSTSCWLSWRTGWSLQTRKIAPATPAGQVMTLLHHLVLREEMWCGVVRKRTYSCVTMNHHQRPYLWPIYRCSWRFFFYPNRNMTQCVIQIPRTIEGQMCPKEQGRNDIFVARPTKLLCRI